MHDHHHHHGADAVSRRRLALTLALTAGYMVAEVVGGWLSGSLALLADAGHMFGDTAALALSLVAMWIAQRPRTPQQTYGYARSEILAASINGAALFVIAVFVAIEAIGRLESPPEVQGPLAAGVAAGGLLMNLVALRLLWTSKDHNLNLRGAFLHVLSDALGSVGALLAGAAIWAFGWRWADPVASIAIALLITHAAYQLLKEAVTVLMEGAPAHIDVGAVIRALSDLGEVRSVHDVHVWTISSKQVLCSVHAIAVDDAERALAAVTHTLHSRFGIHHVTVQVESPDFARSHCLGCEQAAE